MEINLQGKVTHAQVYESVILSDYRLTYREIDEIVKSPSSQPSPLEEKGQATKRIKDEALLSFKGEEIQR